MGDQIDSYTTGAGNLTMMLDNTRLEGSLGLGLRPGNYVNFLTGALAGQERLVTGFTWGSLMTFAPAVITAVPSGIQYELHNSSVKTYNDALKRAEERLRPQMWLDELVELTWNTGSLAILVGTLPIDTINDVQFYDSYTSNWYSAVGPIKNPKRPVWRIVPGQSPVLQFYSNWFTQPAAGATWRIYGQRHALLMTLDTDTCEIFEDWVLDIAEMEVHLSRDTGSRDAAQRTQRAGAAWQRFSQSGGSMIGPKPNSIALKGR